MFVCSIMWQPKPGYASGPRPLTNCFSHSGTSLCKNGRNSFTYITSSLRCASFWQFVATACWVVHLNIYYMLFREKSQAGLGWDRDMWATDISSGDIMRQRDGLMMGNSAYSIRMFPQNRFKLNCC